MKSKLSKEQQKLVLIFQSHLAEASYDLMVSRNQKRAIVLKIKEMLQLSTENYKLLKKFVKSLSDKKYSKAKPEKNKEARKRFYEKNPDYMVKWHEDNSNYYADRYSSDLEKSRNKARTYRANNYQRALEQNKKWRSNNTDRISQYTKAQYYNNSEKFKQKNKKWRTENNDKVKHYRKNYYKANRSYILINVSTWQKNNPDRVKQTRKNNHNKRMKEDPLYAAKTILRKAVSNSFRRISKNKPANTTTLLGCSWEQAKAHIENLWTEGMCWENYGFGKGKWNIDHIRPVCSFKEDELDQMNLIKNLQPLWHEDNQAKRDKYL